MSTRQVPLNDTLRDDIVSGFVHYEYSTIDFVDSTTGGAPQFFEYVISVSKGVFQSNAGLRRRCWRCTMLYK